MEVFVMKRIMAVVLMVVMCTGLVACGAETPDLNKDDSANKNEYNAIEITMENWSEYFEFTTNYSVYYNKSAFSDTSKEISGVAQDFYFSVKDKYFSRLDTANSIIAAKISTDFGTQKGTFAEDYSSFDPNGEFIIYKKDMIMESVDGDFKVTDHGKLAWHISSAAPDDIKVGEMFKWLTNQNVLNITGTLYIAE
jgi:hypothetical protein